LTLEDASSHLQEILKLLGKIDSVEIRSPTLDDVFLHYTGRAMREGSPEGSWAEKMMNVSDKK
jgi:ABC-2 type transport system ATP-binding protein